MTCPCLRSFSVLIFGECSSTVRLDCHPLVVNPWPSMQADNTYSHRPVHLETQERAHAHTYRDTHDTQRQTQTQTQTHTHTHTHKHTHTHTCTHTHTHTRRHPMLQCSVGTGYAVGEASMTCNIQVACGYSGPPRPLQWIQPAKQAVVNLKTSCLFESRSPASTNLTKANPRDVPSGSLLMST